MRGMALSTLNVFALTCHHYYAMVAEFIEQAWDLERTLTFLTWNEIADLMYVLEGAGALIVGAAVLSFFTRWEMPDMMMDIVVDWRHSQGILSFLCSINFSPNITRPASLLDDIDDARPYLTGNDVGVYPLVHIIEYGRKRTMDGKERWGWVRVIIVDCSPLAVVLSLKSSGSDSHSPLNSPTHFAVQLPS